MKGLEDLKSMLRDDRLWIALGIIKKLHLAEDRSYLKVTVNIMPEDRPIVATMTWEAVGPEAGDFTFPMVDDVVLIAQAEGDDNEAYVIKRLTSRADKIPTVATDGSKVHRAIAGKKYWNISDTRINLSRGEDEPTENLVLGQIFKQFASDLLEIMKTHAQNDADHKHIGNLGYYTFKPDKESDYLERKEGYDTLKQSPIEDEAILSDVSFTEK
jgi:hypothetical protein